MVSPVFHPDSPLPFSHHLLGRVVHTLHNPISTPSKHHHLALFLLLPTVKSPGPVCLTAATFRSLSYSAVLSAHSALFLGLCQHPFASWLAALCLASPPSCVITTSCSTCLPRGSTHSHGFSRLWLRRTPTSGSPPPNPHSSPRSLYPAAHKTPG